MNYIAAFGFDIGEIVSSIFETIFGWMTSIILSTNSVPGNLINMGNGFFNASITICTGFLTENPVNAYPEAWAYVRGLATGPAAIGVANDVFIVFFIITLINYALTVRSKPDPEDILKIIARAFLGKFLVENCVTLIEDFWGVTSNLMNYIVPDNVQILTGTVLPFLSVEMLGFLVNMILAIVYLIVMLVFAFKIISATWKRFIWAYLALPFGSPAFATMVGSGQITSTTKAYIKFIVAIMLEFVAFTILINLLSLMTTGFCSFLITSFNTIMNADDNTFVNGIIKYFANICFAAMVSSLITELDGKVEKMYGL